MRLQDAKAAYQDLSGKASDIVRQLGFAGIALIWLFRTDVNGVTHVPKTLLWPGVLIVLALCFDLLQYVVGSLVWGYLHRQKEKEVGGETDFLVPPGANWPALTFFWGKIASTVAAYILLLTFLASEIKLRQ